MFKPGIRIKRWVILWILGISLFSTGIGYITNKIDISNSFNFLPWHTEGAILLIVGCAFIAGSFLGLYRTISQLIVGNPTLGDIGDTLYSNLSKEKGPNLVVIGGGTGMSVLLKGLKQYTDNLTAIIGVADDGGSSGRLRRELGVIPPGDFRNCIVAMSDEESLLPELFQYRFSEGEGLKGHSFGNLFIVAMSHVADSFENALLESSRVLAVRGKITPATTANLNLSARMEDGKLI
ncbi:MAG: 2-phospho-L-lactate transferase CofD family protein, partial [Chloroflexota bacterium]|nr:2-phospho-L-lactate transferase CofD family protein [Chloroflexota bacterium]